jgi:hypothetical protein
VNDDSSKILPEIRRTEQKEEVGEPGSAEARGAFGFFDLLGNALP